MKRLEGDSNLVETFIVFCLFKNFKHIYNVF